MVPRIETSLWYAISIQFLATGIAVLTAPYTSSLFLSTYPSSWLPFLYLAEGAATTLLLVPQRMLIQRFQNAQIYLAFIFIGGIVLGYYLLQTKIFASTFLFVTLLDVITLLTVGMAWLVITLAFEVRTFRQIGTWLSVSATLGGITFSVPVIVLSKININYILLVIIFLLLLLAISLKKLKPLPQHKKERSNITPVQEKKIGLNLFYFVLAFTVISTILSTLGDYNLRSLLPLFFQKQAIATFLAIFLAIANVLTLFSELLGTKRLIESYGVISLLIVMPIFALIFAIVGIFIPTLWMATILFGVIYICHYSFNSLGREIILNVLPTTTKRSWLFQIKFILRPFGTLLGGLFAWSLGTDATMRKICVAIIVVSLLLLLLLYVIKRNYLSTLKKFLDEKYFNVVTVYGIAPETKKELALQAIRTNKNNLIRFGLGLYADLKIIKPLPNEILALAESPDNISKMTALQIIHKAQPKKSLPFLMQKLSTTDNPELLGGLLHLFRKVMPKPAQDFIKQYRDSDKAEIRASVVKLLLATKSEKNEALSLLNSMLSHPDSAMRIEAANIIGTFHLTTFIPELKKLFRDKNKEVSCQAIAAAQRGNFLELLPDIVLQLEENKTHFCAAAALTQFGDKVVPALVNIIDSNVALMLQIRAMQVLASIEGVIAEKELARFCSSRNKYLATIASKYLAFRGQQFGINNQAVKNNAKEYLLNEARYINLLTMTITPKIDPSLTIEINSRKDLAIHRYLYWLAIHALPQNILPALNVLFSANSGLQNRANTLEYLDTSLKDKEIAKSLSTVFEPSTSKKSHIDLNKIIAADFWLQNFLLYQQNKLTGDTMAIVETVIELRAVELFSALPAEILMEIAKVVENKKLAKGETLFLQNDPPTGMYIITAGKVEMIRDKKTLATLSEGEWFGELALLDDYPRAATAVAISDVSLLYISKTAFDYITDEYAEVLKGIMKVVMGYLRNYMKNSITDELNEKPA